MFEVQVASINGNTNHPLRSSILIWLSSFSDNSINILANSLTEKNSENELVIVTKPIKYFTRNGQEDVLNREYANMQKCIANAPKVCSVLGIRLSVKEKKKYERDYSIFRRVTAIYYTYTLTLKNIELDKLKDRAKAYQISCEDNLLQQIRNDCNKFYQHICNSSVVETVSSLFAEKIMEVASNRFISTFHINFSNSNISLDYYDDRFANFSFLENGLTDLSDENQRFGFAFAVIDKTCFKLKNYTVLGTKNDIYGKETITNKARLRFNSEFSREQFELTFEVIKEKRQTKDWY